MSTKKTYGELLKHPKWQMRRLKIFERDGAKCTLCGDTETTLNVHHLKYHGSNPWDAPDEDLITLCEMCHLLVEEFKGWGAIESYGFPVRVMKGKYGHLFLTEFSIGVFVTGYGDGIFNHIAFHKDGIDKVVGFLMSCKKHDG